MPTLSGNLEPEGALVTVEIGLTRSEIQRLRQAGQPIPAAVALRALLDSGAECSCVDPRALATLALSVKNVTLANVPALGGLIATTQFIATVTIVHPLADPRLNLVNDALHLTGVPLATLGYEVLIGRDILGRCRFLYDGPGGRFRLRY